MCKGERPIGAAKGKQTNTMASCQPPPPPRGSIKMAVPRRRGGIPPLDPPPQTKVTVVGHNEIYNRDLIGPFLLAPRPPLPPF